MALKYLIASGNTSNPAIWNGGTNPVAGDHIHANGFTGTIDEDVNWLYMSTRAEAPAVAGGGFVVTTNRNITASCYAGSTTCLSVTGVGITVNVIGSGYGSLTAAMHGILLSGAGSTLNIIGDGYGGSAATATGIYHNGPLSSVINVTGNGYGGGAVNTWGITAGNSGPVYVTGNVYGGTGGSASGLRTQGTAFCVIYGNSYGGVGASGTDSSGGANYFIINGSAVASNTMTGATSAGTASSYAHTAVGNQGTANIPGALCNIPSAPLSVSNLEYGPIGQAPATGFILFKNDVAKTVKMRLDNGTYETISSSTADFPAPSNVRKGISYDLGNKIGACEVPVPSAVASGAPVDNTVGTALLTGDAVLEAINASVLPLAQRLKNCSTVESTGAQISAAQA